MNDYNPAMEDFFNGIHDGRLIGGFSTDSARAYMEYIGDNLCSDIGATFNTMIQNNIALTPELIARLLCPADLLYRKGYEDGYFDSSTISKYESTRKAMTRIVSQKLNSGEITAEKLIEYIKDNFTFISILDQSYDEPQISTYLDYNEDGEQENINWYVLRLAITTSEDDKSNNLRRISFQLTHFLGEELKLE